MDMSKLMKHKKLVASAGTMGIVTIILFITCQIVVVNGADSIVAGWVAASSMGTDTIIFIAMSIYRGITYFALVVASVFSFKNRKAVFTMLGAAASAYSAMALISLASLWNYPGFVLTFASAFTMTVSFGVRIIKNTAVMLLMEAVIFIGLNIGLNAYVHVED